jgi:uncharacterized membrane protein
LGTVRVRTRLFFLPAVFLLLAAASVRAQIKTPPPPPAQKPAAKTPGQQQQPAQDNVPSPVSKHYPILVVAHGNEPFWGLRLGMKGPERLDRAGYPPIVLEPAEVSNDEPSKVWTYRAKDTATGAAITIKLTREPCSDGMSDTKYTFAVQVDHAQIGTLKGCGQSEPERFPEFRKKNQPLDMPDDAPATDKDNDKDKTKNPALDPITKFQKPVATAYLDTNGRVVFAHGEVRKTVAPAGSELAVSHDGKKLLYTRSDSNTGPERSIVLYEFDTAHSRDIAGTNVRQAFWSPDDSRIAYLKYDGKAWQVFTAPIAMPENATVFSSQNVDSLHGWVSPNTLLASDMQNAYLLSEDKPTQTVPLKEIYGDAFQIMSGDTIRVCPINSDLLLVSAYYLSAPAGAPTDTMGLNETLFLYELKSKRRTILGPPDAFARDGEWSRDALQIFFTKNATGKGPVVTDRIFWDGTGEKRYSAGHALVVGK